MFSILSRLESIILNSFERYELEEQKIISQNKRRIYLDSLHKFFTEVISRLDDSRFLSSFYDDITLLYIQLDNNEIFISKIINYIVDDINQNNEIRLEILYSGYKNSFDLIINYTLGILKNILNLSRVDSSKLLQLVNFYSRYNYSSTKSKIKQLKKSDQPQRFIRERFLDLHKRKVYNITANFISAARRINSSISDSADYSENNYFKKPISSEILKQTWGGEGLSIYNINRDLDILSRYFGRTEDSVAGETQLIDKYLSFVKSASFGSQSINSQEFYISGNNFFGKFNQLFAAGGESNTSLWGLEFLSPLTKTRAFQSVDKDLDPVKFLFRNGIKDRLGEEKLGIKDSTTIVPISLYINSLLKHAQKIGGYALSLLNSLDSSGRLKYYEGLGNLKYPLESLVAVFPVATISCGNNNPSTGIIGALENILTSITNIQDHINLGSLPGKTLEEMVPWFDSIKNKVETLYYIIKNTGYKAGDLLPDVPLQVSGKTREDYYKYFKSIGYSNNKIEKILNSRNLIDLITAFEYQMTSSDVKSFFQGYDFSKFIYTISGEEGIITVRDYLINPDENGLARLFSILDVNPDRFLKIDQYKYGKLIGSLLSVEKIANISAIEKLIPYFKAKNSTIGQSLKIVSDFGLDNPIKDSFDISVVNTMLNQLSRGFSNINPISLDLSCKEALVDAPESLRQWIELIDRSRGNADLERLVGFLENNHGITYSELADVLRTVEAPGFSLLSGILEGYQGGAFTRILKDIYASGLAVLMRKETAYSPHKPRFVQEDTDDLFIGLITTLEKFSVDSQLINFRLLISPESSSITSISDDRGLDFSLIANLSNKPLDSYSILIESLGPDRSGRLPYTYNKTILQETINSGGVSEPPGLGNSPRLTREYPEGILSPELGFLLEKDLDTTPFSSIEFTSPVPFVKIDKENLYQRRISDINYSTIEGIDDIGSGGEEYRDGISVERLFNTLKSNSFDPTSDYIVEKIPAEVSIPISGSYYITNNNIYNANFFDPNLSKLRFNPIESCIEFGTSEQKCRQLFKDYQEVSCKEYLYNKSSLIEQSPRPTTLVSSSIPLDRPLGVSGSLNPSGTFLQNPYKRLPHYIEDNEIEPNALSSSGEPLGVNISLLENLPGLENTSIGLNSFLRKNPKPKNEQECSRYTDINNIQKCFNVLRCMKLRDRRPKYCEGLEYD